MNRHCIKNIDNNNITDHYHVHWRVRGYRPTDRPTDIATQRAAIAAKNFDRKNAKRK